MTRSTNLVGVTDALGNQTTIGYDALGRKTSMDDPDMGAWSYEYDPSSSLVEQTDANGNTLCFTYDQLNRIDTKEIGSAPCPGTDILASYNYDNPTNGIGQLSSVYWGANLAQNNDTFSYDSLGRMYQQERLINGRTYSMQTLSYDALNRPLQVHYPNGEIITMTYDREGANTLTAGSATDPDILVTNVRYNAMGQLTYIDRDHTSNQDTEFRYAGATNNFRLEQIVNGTETINPGSGDNRPDFTYEYDAIGNITSMDMFTSVDGTDLQDFTYDSLNRLVTADTTVSVAEYNQSYSYTAIGNIDNYAGVEYRYLDANHTHAVTHLDGVQKFWYDANGNMVGRIDEDGEFTQIFDEENRLVYVADFQDNTFNDSFASKDTSSWLYNSNQEIPHTLPGGEIVIQSSGTGNNYDGNFWRTAFSLANGDSVRLEFQVTGTDTIAHFGIETSGGWGVDGSRFALLARNDGFDVQERVGSNDPVYTPLPISVQLNTWYVLTLVVDDTNGLALHLYPKDTPNTSAAYYQTTSFPKGESWRFHHWIRRDIAYIDNYSEQPVTGFAYDASGLRLTQTLGENVTYTPFSGYEEEVRPPLSAGTIAAAPMGAGSVALAAPLPLVAQQAEQTQPTQAIANLILYAIPLVLLTGLAVLCLAELSQWVWQRKDKRALSRGTLVSLFILLFLAGLAGLGQRVEALSDIEAGIEENPTDAQQTGLLAPVAAPWTNADIGDVGADGAADEASGTFTIDGSGDDIGGTVDAFHYVYQPLPGDGSIVARVASQTTPAYWSRAGVMMRESLAADSPHVTVVVMSRANRVHTLQRSTAGGTTTMYSNSVREGAPTWLKLERVGSTITSFHSSDGVTWTQLESLSTTMSGTIYVGMAVTSYIEGTLSTATFDNVSVNGGTPPPCSYGPYDLGLNSRVEAEDFRCGGEGVAFHEDLAADTGPGSGDYRTDVSTDGPDIQTTTDVGGGYNLGWTRPGEWLEYEVIAPQTGTYDMTLRFAVNTPWTSDLRLTTSQGGLQLGDSGVMSFGSTGGAQIWVDHVVSLPLGAGTNIVRLANEGGRGNINYIDIVPAATPTPTATATATSTPTATPTASPTNTPTPAGDISGVVRYLAGSYIRWANADVMLWDESTTTLLSTTVTDENGYYEFTQLPAGSYKAIACGYVGSTSIAGERLTTTVPNPSVDVFANAGTCPVETPPPTTPQTITVYAAGSAGNDGSYPTMELRLNDEVVATFTDVQGDPVQRDFQAFTYTNNYWTN